MLIPKQQTYIWDQTTVCSAWFFREMFESQRNAFERGTSASVFVLWMMYPAYTIIGTHLADDGSGPFRNYSWCAK